MESERKPSSRAMLVLSYLAFLGVIPLLFARADPEVRWHARNGLSLFGAVAGITLVATLVGTVPAFGCLYATLMYFLLVLYAFIAILAIVKALAGQRLLVPGISRYAGRR